MKRKSNAPLVFIGTYTQDSESKGIYTLKLDPEKSSMEVVAVTDGVTNPSFLAVHPDKRFLFTVNEVGGNGAEGSVASYKIDPNKGSLKPINSVLTKGSGPCHLSTAPSGDFVYVANYSSGSVASIPVSDGGELDEPTFFAQHEGSSVDPRRQNGPHAHSVTVDPTGSHVFACDLGLDRIIPYPMDADTGMSAASERSHVRVEPGAGPRHMAFHPTDRFAYVVNEMGCTVTAFRYAAKTGRLTTFQTISTLPDAFSGSNTCADIHVSPNGACLYASNRGHDSLAVFGVNPSNGALSLKGHVHTHGKTPRNFAVSPDGKTLLVANQDSDTITMFSVEGQDGMPVQIGAQLEIPKPVCVVYLHDGS